METSLFIDFMGDSPKIRILDYLLTERELDFSITDLARNAMVGRATLYRIWDSLIRNEIIKYTRNVGKAKLYKLNRSDRRIRKLIEIYDALIVDSLKSRAKMRIEA